MTSKHEFKQEKFSLLKIIDAYPHQIGPNFSVCQSEGIDFDFWSRLCESTALQSLLQLWLLLRLGESANHPGELYPRNMHRNWISNIKTFPLGTKINRKKLN